MNGRGLIDLCGHFGVLSSDLLTDKLKNVFVALMILSVPRGRDSTGIMGAEKTVKDGKPHYLYGTLKKAAHAHDFIRQKKVGDLIQDKNHILMGHVRHATIGGVKTETAHPFDEGGDHGVVGFHNGTIRNYKEVDDLSDSHRFYKRTGELGFKGALEELPQDSAYAFCFWDKSNGLVHLFRNKRRELFVCFSKDKKSFIYASEKRFIEGALAHIECRDEFGDIGLLPTNSLWHIDTKGSEVSVRVVPDYIEKAVLEKHEKTGTASAYNYNSSGVTWEWDYDTNDWKRPETAGSVSRNRAGLHSSTAGPTRIIPRAAPIIKGQKDGDYPYTSYEYDPYDECVKRKIQYTKQNSKTTYFRPGNPAFRLELDNAKRYLVNSRGGVWIVCNENDDYSFTVYLSTGKIRKIDPANDRWDGWWNTMEALENLWSDTVDDLKKRRKQEMEIPHDLVLNWNDAHSLAAKSSRWSGSARPVRKPEEQGEDAKKDEDDQIPFDLDVSPVPQEDTYLGWHYEEWDKKEAEFHLGRGCENCGETSTVSDPVYWYDHGKYVCEPCTGLSVVQHHVCLTNATLGQLKKDEITKLPSFGKSLH